MKTISVTTPLTYTAGAQDENTFLRDLLASKLLLSHSLVVNLKQQNKIQVNGQLVHTNYRIQAGDLVTINIDLIEENKITAESIPLNIVYEDEDFVVVNKPAGMSIHPSHLGGMGTLANAVTFHWQGLGKNTLFRPINRLDKDTSGLVLIGKSQFAHQGIFNQVKEHTLNRRYIALVEGSVTSDQGHIDQPIARLDDHKRQRTVHPNGKSATTFYQVLDRYPDHTLLSLKLETGRTHQIRVHLSHIGHPISGDLLYGFASPLIKRHALHADRIRFTHPRSSKEVTIDIPLAKDIQTAVDYLGNKV